MHDESGGSGAGSSPGSSAAPQTLRLDPLRTVPLNSTHRRADFVCKSKEVTHFIREKCTLHIEQRYCRVFVLSDPSDSTDIFGFYSLSPSVLLRDQRPRPAQKRVPEGLVGLPAPMALIGYMGRSDKAPKGLGEALLVDAARRAYRNEDLVVWGLILAAEGGPKNKPLWDWYLSQKFIPARQIGERDDNVMYAPLKTWIPELHEQAT